MRTGSLMTIFSAVLLLMFALQAEPRPALAQDDTGSAQSRSAYESAGGGRIEGLWDVTVTLRSCDTGAPIVALRALNTYAKGGTLTETGAGPLPILRGPGLGTWQYLGGLRYSSGFRFFILNPDGSLAGMYKIAREIELSHDGESYTATASVQIFDPSGNLIQTGCATETASRLE